MITGGSGDLGHVLCRRAVAAGYDVAACYLTRPERIAAGRPILLDLRDPSAVQSALDAFRPDVVIHTAVTQTPADPQREIVDAARNLSSLSRAARPETRLIFLSSDMVFDGTRAPYREDDPPSPCSAYGRGKADMEPLGDCVVRTSLIYDFERGNRQVDWLLDHVGRGEWCTLFRDEYRSPIWALNLADALLELAESNFKGILNVAGPQRMSRADLGRALLRALGYTPDEHIEIVSQADTGRPPDLTLDVSRARRLLRTALLTPDEAFTCWQAAQSGSPPR